MMFHQQLECLMPCSILIAEQCGTWSSLSDNFMAGPSRIIDIYGNQKTAPSTIVVFLALLSNNYIFYKDFTEK